MLRDVLSCIVPTRHDTEWVTFWEAIANHPGEQVAQGYELRRMQHYGWGWYPSIALLNEWIDKGEIG